MRVVVVLAQSGNSSMPRMEAPQVLAARRLAARVMIFMPSPARTIWWILMPLALYTIALGGQEAGYFVDC